jgi:hypothetical protein
MLLKHCTDKEEEVLGILRTGIKPASLLGRNVTIGGSNPNYVYLAAVNKPTECTMWGIYGFLLAPEYVRQNSNQFRFHIDKPQIKDCVGEDLRKFVDEMGFEESDEMQEGRMGFLEIEAGPQIISLKPIPLEAITTFTCRDTMFSHRDIAEEIRRINPNIRILYIPRDSKVAVEL